MTSVSKSVKIHSNITHVPHIIGSIYLGFGFGWRFDSRYEIFFIYLTEKKLAR